jgi:sugar O-acyltransferase (sialic acid O-acetyltransferase NeuD family)
MNRLLIIGAGGFGREVYAWAGQIPRDERDWEVGGFLDANLRALEGFQYPISVLADPAVYAPQAGDCFACAIGDPKTRLSLCRGIRSRGGRFVTLRHPSVIMGTNCRIGDGCILCPGAVLTSDVTLGDFVVVNVYACVAHDVVVGDGSILSPHSDVNGFGRLGEGVFLGTHAAVLPGAKVGDYGVVGAGSVVLKRVASYATVIGVPAKQICRAAGK